VRGVCFLFDKRKKKEAKKKKEMSKRKRTPPPLPPAILQTKQSLSRPLNPLEIRRIFEWTDPLDWRALSCINRQFLSVFRHDVYFDESTCTEDDRADLRHVWFSRQKMKVYCVHDNDLEDDDDDDDVYDELSIQELINRGYYQSLRRLRWRSGGAWAKWESVQTIAECRVALSWACARGNVKMLRLLDEEFYVYDWDNIDDKDKQQAFVQAVRFRRIQAMEWFVRRFFYDNGDDPSVQNNRRSTFSEGLLHAAGHGLMDSLDWLLERCDASTFHANARYVWLTAAIHGHTRVLQHLAKLSGDKSPALYTVSFRELLEHALSHNRVDTAVWLLDEFKQTMTTTTTTPDIIDDVHPLIELMAMMHTVPFEALRLVIKRFNFTFASSDAHTTTLYQTVLRRCMVGGRLTMVQWLLTEKRPTAMSSSSSSSSSWSLLVPLHYAVMSGNFELIEWLTRTYRLTRDDVVQGDLHCILADIPRHVDGAWGSVDLARWLTTKFAITREEVRANDNLVFHRAASNHDVALLEWLTEQFALTARDARADDDDVLREAQNKDSKDILAFLKRAFGIRSFASSS
jgi:hypothetical protein